MSDKSQKIDELLKVLDLTEKEQWAYIASLLIWDTEHKFSFDWSVPEHRKAVLADLAFRLRDEVKKEKRIKDFQGYTVDENMMSFAKSDAIFLHCLPAYYGYEVTKEVAHGKQSVIFDEAENRLWAQIAIMVTLCK